MLPYSCYISSTYILIIHISHTHVIYIHAYHTCTHNNLNVYTILYTILYHSECDKALLCIRAIEALTCDPDNPSLQKSTPKQCTWLTPEFQHSLVTSTFCIHGKNIYTYSIRSI